MRLNLKKVLFEYKGFLLLLLLMFVARSSIMDWNSVPSASMKPTIVEGDRILIDKLAYDVRFPFLKWKIANLADPDRADVIVIDSKTANKRLIKRVMAIPGDTISLIDNVVQINGKPLLQAYYSRNDNDLGSSSEFSEIATNSNMQEVTYFIRLYFNQKDISPLKNMDEIVIPEGFYFVMGDNRHVSDDSRLNLKLVPRSEIIGKATHIVFSSDYGNYYLPRSDRWMIAL